MPAARPRRARPGSDLRILRAAVFAAVCVVLAGIGHALASCAAVPLWALGAGYLGIFLVALPFTGRERSLAGTAALLAVCQTSLHSLFGLLQQGAAAAAQAQEAAASDAALVRRAARLLCGTAGVAISPARAQRVLSDAGIGTGGAATPGPRPAADAVPAMAPMSAGADGPLSLLPSLPMTLAHLLAAVVAGWLLRRGDLALLRIAEMSALTAQSVAGRAVVRSLRAALALVRALRAGLPGAPEAGPRFLRAETPRGPAPRTVALQHAVIRRGPPAVVLAA